MTILSEFVQGLTGFFARTSDKSLKVASTTLISGEDTTNDWLRTADGATAYQTVLPLPGYSTGTPTNATGGAMALGSNSLTGLSAVTGIMPGMVAYSTATGFPCGATVVSVSSSSSVTLNRMPDAAVSAASVNFLWGLAPNPEVSLGTGDIGDYLKVISIKVNDSNYSQVIVRDGNAPDLVSMVTTGSSSTTSMINISSATTLSPAGAYAGYIIRFYYTPTGYSSAITIKRKIMYHTNGVSPVIYLDHPLPSAPGATVACWIESSSSFEILPNGMNAGLYFYQVGKTSKAGGWKLGVDIGSQATAIGEFSI
jgi:hypothetical protein